MFTSISNITTSKSRTNLFPNNACTFYGEIVSNSYKLLESANLNKTKISR